MNARRIQKAIKNGYKTAWQAATEARECKRYNDRIGFRAAIETIEIARATIADCRLSLRLGRLLHASECRLARKAA